MAGGRELRVRVAAAVEGILGGADHFALEVGGAGDGGDGDLVRAGGQVNEHAEVRVAVEILLEYGPLDDLWRSRDPAAGGAGSGGLVLVAVEAAPELHEGPGPLRV